MRLPLLLLLASLALLAALPASAQPAADAPAAPAPAPAPAVAAAGPHLLLIEPLAAIPGDPLLPRLLDRLRPIGDYRAAAATAETILEQIRLQPSLLGLMRRSSLSAERLARSGATFIEIGPATCLVLAVAETAPWQSYAELGYRLPARGLRIQIAGDGGAIALARLERLLPLRAPAERLPIASLRLGMQQLLNGEADLLVLEVVRRGQSETPPAVLVEMLKSGIRLLALPTHLLAPAADGAILAPVPLEEDRFWRRAERYPTLCDPFALVFAPAFADDLLTGLQLMPSPGSAAPPAPDFVSEIGAALRSFVAMIRARLG